MPISRSLRRRVVALGATGALSLGLLATTSSALAVEVPGASSGVLASGPDFTVTRVAGGYEVTLALPEPLPMVSDAPTLLVDGVELGLATESADGRSLSIVTADPAAAEAESVDQGWLSGGDKATPSDQPVTAETAPAVRPDTARRAEELAARDGSEPGEFGYRMDDYDFGDQAIAQANIGGVRGELTGRIYLTDAPGARPTVILLHGRHTSCSTLVPGTSNPNRWPCVAGQIEVPSFKGYDGTGQTLATHGYNVVSISANSINANDNQLAPDNGAQARGQLVLDTLSLLEDASAGRPVSYEDRALGQTLTLDQALASTVPDSSGPVPTDAITAADLLGAFDLDQVGLMGHSRGGEGVVSAVTLNQALADPFGITSVLPLAPVDFGRMTVTDTPMNVVLPYCDGDVSNQQGQHFIDDSRYAYDDSVLLSTVWVMGANHNFFNTIWTPGLYPYSVSDDWSPGTDATCGNGTSTVPKPTTSIRNTPAEQYDIGTAYMSAWFRLTVGSEPEEEFLPMFDGSVPQQSLESVPTADIRVIGHAPTAGRVDIEPFVAQSGRVRPLGAGTANLCASVSTTTLPQPFAPCFTPTTARGTAAVPHWTPASFGGNVPASVMGRYLWTATTGNNASSLRISVPTQARDLTAYDTLLFKTAPDESVVTGTDLTLSVVDSAGAVWSSPVSALSPRAVTGMPASTNNRLDKIVLQQVSVPTSSITGIATDDIREIRIAGAVGADGTEAGGAYLSDLALVDNAVGTVGRAGNRPAINIAPTAVEEGSSIDTQDVAVYLTKPAATTVDAAFSLVGSTAATGKAGVAMQRVTFTPGETCRVLSVPTQGDATPGTTALSTFKMSVSDNHRVITGKSAVSLFTIREDDGTVATGNNPVVPPAPAVGAQGDVCAEARDALTSFALSSSDTEPAPGETVTLSGTGFRSGESVSFTDLSTSPATPLGSALAGADGIVSLAVTLPADAALGAREVSAVGAGSQRSAIARLAVGATSTGIELAAARTTYGAGGSGVVRVRGAVGGSVQLSVAGTTTTLALDAGGVAGFTVPTGLTPGSYPITAAYAGTSGALPSSGTATYAVTPAASVASAVVLTSVEKGRQTRVKVAVTVTGVAGALPPSGTVRLRWGKAEKTRGVPASGVVSVTFKTTGSAPRAIRALYSGDAQYAGARDKVRVR